MPRSVTLDDRTLLGAAGGVSVLLIGLTLALGRTAYAPEVPTTYSAGLGGSKALYQLLEASHYTVGRWERPLRDLPRAAGTTLILAEPEGNPTMDDRQALERFIAQGGRVIATGVSGAFFLPEHRQVPDPIGGLTWKRIPSRSPASITRAAADITLAPQAYWALDSSALALYGDDDKVRVVKYAIGRGEVIWWASATPVTNAGAREPGNLEFVLACVGDRHQLILWDEYVHGYRETVSASLIASPFRWVAGQLALLVAAVLLTYSRRSGPIVAAEVQSRLSPLEFVRTLGALYQRAGAAPVAVDIAYQQFRHRLTQRLGLSGTASADVLQRAVRDRWRHDDRALGELLLACDAARREPGLPEGEALGLTGSLWDYTRKLDLVRASARENV